MTKSSVFQKLAICAFTVAATATFSSLAGQAQAQQRPFGGQPGFNAGGNLPVAGAGAVPISPLPPGSGGQRPPDVGPGFNAGGNLPVGGAGAPVVVGGNPGTTPPNPPATGGPGGRPNVPEPLSVLGSLAAIGFGSRFMQKRKQMLASDKQA